MSKYKYSETERQINSVLKHHDEDLKSIHFPSLSEADATVAKADALLRRLGYQPDAIKGLVPVQPRKTMVIPTWEQCCAEAETHVGTDCELESLFTEEELRSNELAIKQLNEEFNAVHRLDGHGRKFCVSDFRQTQEYHSYDVHNRANTPCPPLSPSGWNGMRAGTA